MRAGVPVIPIAVGRLRGGDAGRAAAAGAWPAASGSPTSPSRPTCSPSGPLGVVTPFPAKFKLRVLDPVHFDVPADQERYSKSRIMEESERIRIAAAGGGLRHAARPAQRLVRVSAPMSRRVLVTGADTFWGGRMIQALETDPSMDVILGHGHAERPRSRSSGPSSSGPTRPTPS